MLIAISLFFSTFILEDVALGSALALISQGKLNFLEAFLICSLGIGSGDLGLYLFGRFASRFSFFRKKTESPQFKSFLESLKKNRKMDYAIVISRAIPGTRVPTYFAAGVMNYSISRFLILTFFSVSAWVFAALYFGNTFFALFHDRWILALFLFLLLFSLGKKVFSIFKNEWSLKAAKYSWKRWLYFEFWPSWFFYLPIIPFYLLLSLRYRSFLIPFYASPHLKHGGLIGESKWDFLKLLDPTSPATLAAFTLDKNGEKSEVLNSLAKFNIQYPFVAKPDVGQRGFGVRVIKNEEALMAYLAISEGDVIVQAKSQYQCEAGVFYVKPPKSADGFIFSITDKSFPFVVGDGTSRLGDLILQDKRAQIVASVYFERHQDKLETVIPNGEEYFLAECGNHCQGAIFKNGKQLATPQLLAAIEEITSRIPDFYFGRIDIRYQDEDSLKKGINFEIIEVNGAGSEATHIWDANTKLVDAYSVLFQQWSHLFSIGYALKIKRIGQRPNLYKFILDCAKVYFRKGPLTTSS